MSRKFDRVVRFGIFSVLALSVQALSGCAGAGVTESVRALQGAAPDPATPDFVRESRPATPGNYIPVGVTPPSRPTPVRNAADAEKLEKELTGQRDRTKAFANRPKPQSTYDGSVPHPARAPKAAPKNE